MATETLVVDTFDATSNQWMKQPVGGTPWLGAVGDSKYIYTGAAKTDKYYTFANSAVGAGTITKVEIGIYYKWISMPYNNWVDFYFNNGGSDVIYGYDNAQTAYAWEWQDVTGGDTWTWAKINAAKLRLTYNKIYLETIQFLVDAAAIRITYTAVGGVQKTRAFIF